VSRRARCPARRRAGAGRALALAGALACGSLYAPQPVPLTDDSVRQATAVLREAAARRGDVRLVEGGVALDAYFYEWREWLEWEELEAGVPGELSREPIATQQPYLRRERMLVGPRSIYVPLEQLGPVRVRTWAFGSGVEIELPGQPEPAFLETADVGEAERLAAALDVLRRAGVRRPRGRRPVRCPRPATRGRACARPGRRSRSAPSRGAGGSAGARRPAPRSRSARSAGS